jgi:hypothetical protein
MDLFRLHRQLQNIASHDLIMTPYIPACWLAGQQGHIKGSKSTDRRFAFELLHFLWKNER